MKNQNEALTELKEKLKNYTLIYLKELGIEQNSSGFISCLNPDHEDRNPSMSWWPNGGIFHCFSCDYNADIFKIAHLYENKPLYGKEFITENIFYLARKFNEPYDHINIEITPEERAKFRKFEIMRLLEDYVISHKNDNYLIKRGIKKKTAMELGIGSIDEYENLVKTYKDNGFEENELSRLGITKGRVNKNKLIFIIRNVYGQPISFVSREMIFIDENLKKLLGIDDTYKNYKGKEKGEFLYACCGNDKIKIEFVQNFVQKGKYENGRDSEIYSKKSIFYGYSSVKNKMNTFEKVLIVEGYIDFVTAYQQGFTNIIALGSASFTNEHLDIIESSVIKYPAITFDQDTTGIKRAKALTDRIKENGNIRKKYFIAKYKEESKDLDEILISKKVNHFNEIFEFETLFQYSISNLKTEGMEEHEIIEEILPTIMQETSPMIRDKMASELEKKLITISKHTILKEIEFKLNTKTKEITSLINKVIEDGKKRINLNPDSALTIVEEMKDNVENISINYMEKKSNIFELTNQGFERDEEKKRDERRNNIKTGFPIFRGVSLSPQSVITIASKPNIGKTTYFVNLVKNFLLFNNNTTIFYYSTDDGRAAIKDNLLSSLSGLPREYVKNPIFHSLFGLNSDNKNKMEMHNLYNSKLKEINEWVETKRLALVDSTDITNWDQFERALSKDLNKEEFEDSVVVVIIDSANKIEIPGITNGNERAEILAEKSKKAAIKYDCLILQNFEIRKVAKNEKVDYSKLAGSRRIEYDSDLIITLHQPAHELPDKTSTYWKGQINNEEKNMPIIASIIEKSKIGGKKNFAFFNKLDYTNNRIMTNFSEEERRHLFVSWKQDLNNYTSGGFRK